jgi:hypothetical protein
LLHQQFELPAIFRRAAFVAEVAQLPFAIAHLLLANAIRNCAIGGRTTGWNSLGEDGDGTQDQEGDCG